METDGLVPPPIGSGETPALFKLGGLKFQGLCRDLLDCGGDPQIISCSEYGKNGEAQHGIDLIADRPNDGIDAIQCKAQERFPPQDIRTASEEFLRHIDRWTERGVQRFLVLVGCEVKSTAQRNEIDRQRRRLKQEHGLVYELWDAPTIVNKLRGYPGIVRQHIEAAWADRICNQQAATIRIDSSPPAPSREIISYLADVTDARLDVIREDWRQGRRKNARQGLSQVRANMTIWNALPAPTQASFLRFESSLALDDEDDPDRAAKLLDEAQLLDNVPDDTRLRAAILWRRGKPDEALALLAAPSTGKLVHFKAFLLIQADRPEEAKVLLEGISLPDAETFHLISLCRLASGSIGEARLAIQKAREQSPHWVSVKFTSAVLSYLSALAPAVMPRSIPAWPEPINPSFVLQDTEARRHLRSAHDQFVAIAELDDLKADEKACLDVWIIASLALNPETHDQFEASVKRLLAVRPTHHRAMVWAIAAGLNELTNGPAEAIRQLIIDGKGTPEQILALVQFHVYDHRFDKAARLLDRTELRFQEYETRNIWLGWKAQVVARLGDFDEAMRLAESTGASTESRLLQARLLVTAKACDPVRTLRFLEEAYQKTNDPRFLLDLVEEEARAGQWALAASRCVELFAKIRTTEVHRLVVFCSYHARVYSQCLQLLSEGNSLYALRPPSELREMRVDCQTRLGLLPAGLREAELLAREEPTTPHLLALAQLYDSIGDSRSLCSVAQQLIRISSVSADILLRLSSQVRSEDRTLAIDLWRAAKSRGVQDDHVPRALQLGFDLGLDSHLEEFTVRIQLLGQASHPGVKLAAIEDVIKSMEEFGQESQRMNEGYRKSAFPIHFIVPRLNLTLAQMYHAQLDDNITAKSLGAAPWIYVRGGNRDLPGLSAVAKESFRVFADVTAILTGHHYGFLKPVELTFAPIQIPPTLVPSLSEMRDRLSSGHSQRFKAHEEILKCHLRGSISKYSAEQTSRCVPGTRSDVAGLTDLEAAAERKGFLVDFLPLVTESDRREVSGLPSYLPDAVVGIGSVIRSLFAIGALTVDRRDQLLRMASFRNEPPSAEPHEQAKLYFRGTTIELFAIEGLLDSLTSHFTVLVEATALARLQAELEAHAKRQELARWVAELIGVMNDGIVNGRYRVMSVESLEPLEESEPQDRELAAEALLSLVRIRGKEAGRVWVDDRFGNRHRFIGTLPTMDSLEVLQQLFAHGSVSESVYFATVTRMRASGAMFIPPSVEEILHHVLSANFIGDGGETTALRLLRRGIAASLLAARYLLPSVGGGGDGDLGEYPFLVKTITAISKACYRLWFEAGQDAKGSRRRSDWVLQYLLVPLYVVRGLTRSLPSGHEPSFFAIDAASLFSQGMADVIEEAGRKGARSYNEWLYQRAFRRRFQLEPKLLQQTAEHVKRLMGTFRTKGEAEAESRAGVLAAACYYLSIPSAIQNVIAEDADFLREYGVKVQENIHVGSLQFDRESYFAAAREAINGREGFAIEFKLTGAVRFLPGDDSGEIRLDHPSFQSPVVFREWRLLLLAESPSLREQALKLAQDILDVPPELQDSLAEMASTEDFLRRIAKAEALRSTSLLLFYEQLESKLVAGKSLRDEEFFPSEYDAFVRYLRLDRASDLGEATTWDAFVRGISSSLSLAEQLDRLFRLPIELPAEIMGAVQALSTHEKQGLLHNLFERYGGHLWRIHFEKMLKACLSESEQMFCLYEPVPRVRTRDCRVYLTVVRWVYDQLVSVKEQLRWSAAVVLAVTWSHGDKLFSMLQQHRVSMDWIEGHFSTPPSWVAALLLEGNSLSLADRDIANPHNVTPEVLWACGFNRFGESSTETRMLLCVDDADSVIPDRSLFPTVASAPNALSSFFNCDRLEAYLRLTDNQSLPSDALRVHCEEIALKRLSEGNNDGWLYLYSFVGSRSLPERCAETVRVAMRTWSFVTSGEGGRLDDESRSLYSAALLLRCVDDDEATSHIFNEFKSMLKEAGDRGVTGGSGTLPFLLEIALLLAQSAGSRLDRVRRFCELLGSIVDELPQSVRIIRPVIDALCDELPVCLTTEVWQLRLRLRTYD